VKRPSVRVLQLSKQSTYTDRPHSNKKDIATAVAVYELRAVENISPQDRGKKLHNEGLHI
jgi:hypothetical protein